jgi:hypothetical protein
MSMLSRSAVAVLCAVACALCSPTAQAFKVQVTGSSSAPQMVFDANMRVAQVCLPVTNPQGGQSVLYGQRFTDGPTSALTPAIVLVPGIASSTENWDFSPT